MIEKPECEDFQRECGAEPQSVTENQYLLDHMENCPPCTDFYEYLIELDAKMMSAFSFPVVETKLNEQLTAAQNASSNVTSITKNKNRSKRFQTWFAAAASVAVAAIAVFTVQYPTTTIADDVVEHIHHEPGLLTITQSITNNEKIRQVLKEVNVSLSDSNVEILAAKKCPFGDEFAAHLVVKGESGPLTLIIFPNKETRSGEINTKEFNGRILPAGHGAIAVVGGKKESLAHMEKLALDAFHWQD